MFRFTIRDVLWLTVVGDRTTHARQRSNLGSGEPLIRQQRLIAHDDW